MKALRIAVSLAAFLATGSAYANNGGLPGYSGKPSAIAPAGESCNQCHTGGTAPTVIINGPATLAAGQSAEYTLVVTTAAIRAGGGIAGSDGVVLTNVAGLRDSFGEMVQNAPLTVNGGSATFRFMVKAPSTGTALKLWAVGLAANNSGNQTGDRAAHATRDVTITGGGVAPTPDAGGGGTGDGGGGGVIEGAGGPAAEGGTGTGTGTGNGTGTGTGGGDGDGENAADPDGDGINEDGTPATYGPGRGRSIGGPTAATCAASPLAIDGEGFAAALGMMVLGTMITRRRKRA